MNLLRRPSSVADVLRRLRRLPPRDPRQVRYLTWQSLRWVIRHRAWTWFYLVRFWRLLWLRLRSPHIITEGLVFLGRGVQLDARPGYGRLILGRWVHLGDNNRLRAHEGTLRVGDKVVFGRDNTVNGYLDIEIGASTLVADWVYVCDFDHVHTDLSLPIKDQGIVKAPVRIGAGCWLGVRTTVLRGSIVGEGCVIAAHSVVRGPIPSRSVAGGIPARVLKDRNESYAAEEATRAALADIAAKTARATRAARESEAE